MQVGDLVCDVHNNIGVIAELGWYTKEDRIVDWSHQPQEADKTKQRSYLVHFSNTNHNGWYGANGLEVLCK